MRHMKSFISEVFKQNQRDFFILCLANIAAGIVLHFYKFPSFAEALLIFISAYYCFTFVHSASIMPSMSSDADRFSWKYLQSLPLTKKELIIALASLNVIFASTFMVWFVSFYSRLSYVLGQDAPDYIFLLGVVLAFFPIMFTLSFKMIIAQILYPRKQFSNVNPKAKFLKSVRYIVLCMSAAFCVIYATDWYYLKFGIELGDSFKLAIRETVNFFYSWWGFIPLFLGSVIFYFVALKIWQNDKYGYTKVEWNPGKDLSIISMSIATVAFLASSYDFDTPSFIKDGQFHRVVYIKDWNAIKTYASNPENVNQKNRFGLTPLHVAAYIGDEKIYNYLLEMGADEKIEVQGERDSSLKDADVLRLAVHSNSHELVSQILERGYDPNQKKKDQDPILHIAANKCKSRIVDILIEKGANINTVTDKGNTPLHIAAKSRCFGAVASLIEAGADTFVKNKDGKLAMEMLRKDYNRDLAYYLEKKARVPASIEN